MIYCSQCHKPNSESSRFCNECGTSLATAQRRCQACGTLNAVEQSICSNCGARLMLIADNEPAEVPTQSPPGDQAHPEADAAMPGAPAVEHDDSTPEWLRAFRESAGS